MSDVVVLITVLVGLLRLRVHGTMFRLWAVPLEAGR
jgi:hypothetical protein